MYRIGLASIVIIALAALVVAPVSAAEPVVTKSIFAEDEGTAVIIVTVKAADRAIYGVTITDDTGSITDIIAPKGWAGISSGDRVVFATADTPVGEGERIAFKMVTAARSAPLSITFRDEESMIYAKQTF